MRASIRSKHDQQHASILSRSLCHESQNPRSYPASSLRVGATHLLFSSRGGVYGMTQSGKSHKKCKERGQLTPGQSTKVDEISYGPELWGHGLTLSRGRKKVGREPRPGTMCAMRHAFDSVGRLLGSTPWRTPFSIWRSQSGKRKSTSLKTSPPLPCHMMVYRPPFAERGGARDPQ